MAEKGTATEKTKTTKSEKIIDLDNLNLDAKITVRNLAGWDVTFSRKHDGMGDIIIVADGKQRLSRNEVQAQINSGNKLFIGTDGRGSHATLYIDDEATRRLVGFEDDHEKQCVFTEDTVKELFSMNYQEFERKLPEIIRTRAEKYALIQVIKKLGFNDYRKIVFASNYTGYKI